MQYTLLNSQHLKSFAREHFLGSNQLGQQFVAGLFRQPVGCMADADRRRLGIPHVVGDVFDVNDASTAHDKKQIAGRHAGQSGSSEESEATGKHQTTGGGKQVLHRGTTHPVQ